MTLMEKCKAAGHKCCSLTIIRLVLGIIFFMHGAQLVLGWFGGQGLATTVQGMTGMGLPVVVVYLVAFGELLGGIALTVGFLSRFAGAGIALIMAGAIFMVHLKNGFFMDKGGFEYALALFTMALGVTIGGGGCLSIDSLCCCKKTACCEAKKAS